MTSVLLSLTEEGLPCRMLTFSKCRTWRHLLLPYSVITQMTTLFSAISGARSLWQDEADRSSSRRARKGFRMMSILDVPADAWKTRADTFLVCSGIAYFTGRIRCQATGSVPYRSGRFTQQQLAQLERGRTPPLPSCFLPRERPLAGPFRS